MAGRNMELRQYAEWNITRLGLIPAQSKLPEKYRMAWEQTRGDKENYNSVQCYTAHDSGVPHGLSGDIIAALMTLAITSNDKGSDSNGILRTTLEELDKMMLFKAKPNGKRYQDLHRHLEALTNTRYRVENLWREEFRKRRTNATFSLIERLILEETIKLPGSVEKHLYYIKIDDLLWKSATGGLTLTLNPEIITALESPTSRAIYRMLENHRRSEETDAIATRLSMRAIEFSDSIRLFGSRPAMSDRLLSVTRANGAFDQLKREGYLKSIDIVGHGDNTKLHFEFSDQRNTIHTRAEKLLIDAGIQPSYAARLAQQFTADEVECALWLTEEANKKQKGTAAEIRNPSGFIIKLLTSGDAQAKKDDFKASLNKKMLVRERLERINYEDNTPIVPKSPAEQLEIILKIKKLSTTTATALKEAVEGQKLSEKELNMLLAAMDTEQEAQNILTQIEK